MTPRAYDGRECTSANVPVTAHLLRSSFFLMTVHSQKNGQVRRGGREAERGERYRVRKAGMWTGTYSPQHALLDILVITADEHE